MQLWNNRSDLPYNSPNEIQEIVLHSELAEIGFNYTLPLPPPSPANNFHNTQVGQTYFMQDGQAYITGFTDNPFFYSTWPTGSEEFSGIHTGSHASSNEEPAKGYPLLVGWNAATGTVAVMRKRDLSPPESSGVFTWSTSYQDINSLLVDLGFNAGTASLTNYHLLKQSVDESPGLDIWCFFRKHSSGIDPAPPEYIPSTVDGMRFGTGLTPGNLTHLQLYDANVGYGKSVSSVMELARKSEGPLPSPYPDFQPVVAYILKMLKRNQKIQAEKKRQKSFQYNGGKSEVHASVGVQSRPQAFINAPAQSISFSPFTALWVADMFLQRRFGHTKAYKILSGILTMALSALSMYLLQLRCGN